MRINRRELFKVAGVGAAAVGLSGVSGSSFAFAKKVEEISLPKPSAKSQRVVIVGGGWSGATLAKYLKKGDKNLDVVLIEKRANFFSCPASNLWLVGLIPLEFLVHDHLYAASKYGYHFVNATVHGIDRTKRYVYTEKGKIHYDYLVLATGIDYDYSQWVGTDPKDVEIARTKYPAAFVPGGEHLALKRKIEEFEEGNFVITVPPGLDYRCLPGPYERATLIAWYFKKNDIPGKVILIDPHNDPPVKAEGFHKAWDEYVKGYVEYYSNATIKGVDFGKKVVSTEEYGDVEFEDLNLYPRCKSTELVYNAGLVPKGDRWPKLKWPYNVAADDHRILCTGDARNHPFSKSGNTANTEAHHVAKQILAMVKGKSAEYMAPRTLCYSAVDSDKAVWVDLTYKYDPKKNSFAFHNVKMDNTPSGKNYKAYIEWAKAMYRDMFG